MGISVAGDARGFAWLAVGGMGGWRKAIGSLRLRRHSGLTTPASKERSLGARFCGSKVRVFDAAGLRTG
jgi:hypothetical protein